MTSRGSTTRKTNSATSGRWTASSTEAELTCFSPGDREAVYRAIRARRDVRRGFTRKHIPRKVLLRLLEAAHQAPAVGLMQPSRFLVIRSPEIRQQVHTLFRRANQEASEVYEGPRKQAYSSLKLEGILEADLNVCVLCETESQRGQGLGRHSMPETAVYSTVCAIQNLWLAARTEGIGVGWVSILSHDGLRSTLKIPPHLQIVGYLCLGYVEIFGDRPELERVGWEHRLPLSSVIFEGTCPFAPSDQAP